MSGPVNAAAARPMSTARRVWTVPVILAALTLFGLLAALLGTGTWHLLAWLALLVPIGVGVGYALRPGTR